MISVRKMGHVDFGHTFNYSIIGNIGRVEFDISFFATESEAKDLVAILALIMGGRCQPGIEFNVQQKKAVKIQE